MNILRLLKSLINSFLWIINIILWIFDIATVGEIVTGISVKPNKRWNKFIYGIGTIVQWISYWIFFIGLILTIYWWIMDEESIAERVSGVKQK